MDYIVDFNPYKEEDIDNDYYADIENRISKGETITENEAEDFLKILVYLTRKKIDPNLDNFDYKCDLAQSIMGHYLETINCPVKHCSTLNAISYKALGHNFSIVTLNVEGEATPYLIDATYIQFFRRKNCSKDKVIIHKNHMDQVLITPDPGYFIKEEDQEAAGFLLRYGYIKLTPEYAKMYGDSFYNTKRGIDPDPLGYKEMPSFIYMKTFTRGNEQLSTDKDTLIYTGQFIRPFYEMDGPQKTFINQKM